MSSQPIAIIGTGCVAAAAGWSLSALGQGFYFMNRQGATPWTYQFDAPDQTKGATTISALVPADAATQTELVLLTVKAYDLERSMDHLQTFKKPVVVVSFANGAINSIIEAARLRFPQHIFRLGFSTLGITQMTGQKFQVRSMSGQFHFGSIDQHPQSSAELRICNPKSRFVWNDNILLHHRRKWLFNTVINTLTAARRLPANGTLLVDLPTLNAVFAESFELSELLWGPWPIQRAELYESLIKLIQDTSENENSMAADVRLGRPTESPFLAGLALKHGDRFPLLTAFHRAISG